jgi:hypothetical protein
MTAWPQPDFHWLFMHGGVGLQQQLRQRAEAASLSVQFEYDTASQA